MRKVAFLVGNDTFPKDPTIPPLRFTQNDAREFAAVLEDRETCGFETRLYLNRPSQEVLTGLEQISGELGHDDTLLFYYSGHGKLRGNELCLVSNESITASLGATSIRTRLVLEYLQGSLARRRILILDCCHSGAIASIYKAVDSKSALDGLADSFGSYILTASTTIQLAEEREKDGHGVFTKALIDCLREGPKERITINDLYDYAHSRLKISAQQTPLFWALQQEGTSVEIGNYEARHERERQRKRAQLERERQLHQERLERERQLEQERLISTARTRLGVLVAAGVLIEEQIESIVRLLESNEARLFPRERKFREDVIRFVKGEASFLEVFGAGHILRPEPASKPPEDEVSPPISPPEAPAVDAPVLLSEPPIVYQPVTPREPAEIGQAIAPAEPTDVDPPVKPSAPEVTSSTDGGGELPEAKKPISSLWRTKALFIPAVFAIGVVILAAYLIFSPGTRSVRLEDKPAVAAPELSPVAAAPRGIRDIRDICSEKYQADKAAGTLNGETWPQFYSWCTAEINANPPAAKATPSVTQVPPPPVNPMAATPSTAVFPSAISPSYASEKPSMARVKTCEDQYKANKATNANGGMKWIQKGGGYWSECNKRLMH